MNIKLLISITATALLVVAVSAQKTGANTKLKAALIAEPKVGIVAGFAAEPDPLITSQSMAWQSFTNWTTIGRVIPLSSPNTPLTAVVQESPKVVQVSTVTSNLFLDFTFKSQVYRILMDSFLVTNHVPETRVIEGN